MLLIESGSTKLLMDLLLYKENMRILLHAYILHKRLKLSPCFALSIFTSGSG